MYTPINHERHADFPASQLSDSTGGLNHQLRDSFLRFGFQDWRCSNFMGDWAEK